MANFTLATPQQNQIWSDNFITSYVRASTYKQFISTNNDNIIQVENDLTNKAGTAIHVPVFDKFRGTANDGTTPLVGNEMQLANFSAGFQTKFVRQAFNVQITEELKTELDLRAVNKAALQRYAAELLKNDLITTFNAIPVLNPGAGSDATLEDLIVSYGAASAAQLNAFCAANADRVTFVGGSNTGTMSTSLASVKADTGILSAAVLSAIKDQADATANGSNFAITPYQTKDGNPWYVLFTNPVGFRQLRSDPEIYASTKDALPRESDSQNNPIFTGGDLIWDGIIIKKNRDYGNLGAVGASGAPVAQAHFCGINALARATA